MSKVVLIRYLSGQQENVDNVVKVEHELENGFLVLERDVAAAGKSTLGINLAAVLMYIVDHDPKPASKVIAAPVVGEKQ